jgi:hypothetical protein
LANAQVLLYVALGVDDDGRGSHGTCRDLPPHLHPVSLNAR